MPPSTTIDRFDIDAIIADLARKQELLSDYIDRCLAGGEADVRDVARLLALHGQNASRLGRLLRDRKALVGEVSDELAAALNKALDELSVELGVDL